MTATLSAKRPPRRQTQPCSRKHHNKLPNFYKRGTAPEPQLNLQNEQEERKHQDMEIEGRWKQETNGYLQRKHMDLLGYGLS